MGNRVARSGRPAGSASAADNETATEDAETAPPQTPERSLDIFKMAGKTISGWLPFEKTGITPLDPEEPPFRKALPYATMEERDAALFQAFRGRRITEEARD